MRDVGGHQGGPCVPGCTLHYVLRFRTPRHAALIEDRRPCPVVDLLKCALSAVPKSRARVRSSLVVLSLLCLPRSSQIPSLTLTLAHSFITHDHVHPPLLSAPPTCLPAAPLTRPAPPVRPTSLHCPTTQLARWDGSGASVPTDTRLRASPVHRGREAISTTTVVLHHSSRPFLVGLRPVFPCPSLLLVPTFSRRQPQLRPASSLLCFASRTHDARGSEPRQVERARRDPRALA